ncbi:hypothetical protein [Bradyrhizobium sp. SYSU BS000235]|uniref:hypothetical protein n=1 Tax=Bradyrhizobium sp. SYSU BS000235 TaxID=3411332 RepID=UPI003C71CACB
MPQDTHTQPDLSAEDRRKFLASCGKFAVVTPPAITLLLSTSLNSTAVAQSAGTTGNHSGGMTATELAIAAIAAIAAAAIAATATTATTAATTTVERLRKR